MSSKIGQVFVSSGTVSPEQLQKVEDYQKKAGGHLASHLVRLGAVSESDFTNTLSQAFNCDIIELEDYHFDPKLLELIPQKLAKKHGIAPVGCNESTIKVAMLDPTNQAALEEIAFITSLNVEAGISTPKNITKAQRAIYDKKQAPAAPSNGTAAPQESPVTSSALPPQMTITNKNNIYYSHSGVVGLAGPVIMTVAGFLSARILSYVYVYAITYIPFIYLNFLICFIFGAAVGAAVGFSGRFGQTRNTLVIGAFGLVFGIYATYFSWVIFIDLATAHGVVSSPGDIMKIIDELSAKGLWVIMGWTPKGFSLKLMWIIEALMIIGCSAGIATALVCATPYCERCKKWLTDTIVKERLTPVFEPEAFKHAFEQGNYEALASLKVLGGFPVDYSKIELKNCKKCKQLYFLTLTNVHIDYDEDGNEHASEEAFIVNIRINRDIHEWINKNIL